MRVFSFVSDGSITIIGLFLAAVFGFRTSRQPKSVHCPKNKPCDIPHDLAPCCPVLQLPMSSLGSWSELWFPRWEGRPLPSGPAPSMLRGEI
jgi:hypothetical protein